jgi:multicomponent K+:H+ antiporter subunit E
MRRSFTVSLMTIATLLTAWLLLTESLSPGTILLGGAVALVASIAARPLELIHARFRRPLAAFRLAIIVFLEIVRSNYAVAQIILRPGSVPPSSGFVRIPLTMRSPYGLVALACIITATPGTLLAEYESAGNTILLHVLDLVDEEEWVRTIKDRYESRLMEIFE